MTGAAEDGIQLTGTGGQVRLVANEAVSNGDDGIHVGEIPLPVTERSVVLERNRADHNADLGIEAVPGVTDGGGNRARGNGNPLQCLVVVCRTPGRP